MATTTPSVDQIKQWGSGMWDVFASLAKRPRTPNDDDRRLERLHAEAEILDLFRRYHYLYDAGDVDGVMSLFADDCVVVNQRGTYIGASAIRENYEFLCERRRFIIHYGTNPMVRLDPDFQSGWLSAFWYAIVFKHDGGADATGGTYVDRVRYANDEWRIFEQRITTNFRAALTKAETVFPEPPAPSRVLTSDDLTDPSVRL